MGIPGNVIFNNNFSQIMRPDFFSVCCSGVWGLETLDLQQPADSGHVAWTDRGREFMDRTERVAVL